MGMIRNTIVFSAGYMLGSRAGRERYEQIMRTANSLAQRPEVQQARERMMSSIGMGGQSGSGSEMGSAGGATGSTGMGRSIRRGRRGRGMEETPSLAQVQDDEIIASSDLAIDLTAETETSASPTQRPGTI